MDKRIEGALVEEGRCDAAQPYQWAQYLARLIWTTSTSPSNHYGGPRLGSHASIPRTSPGRLAQASTENNTTASTVLYLAYGSNLSAETFLGRRGIKPISAINVSAPAFDLVFDLPGLPYNEPCFANVTPRKLPKPPIPGPGDSTPAPPKFPPYDATAATPTTTTTPPPPSLLLPSLPDEGPVWNKGLYGVVYEVTREDYATIIKTEGGGASYHDVLTPCLPLAPAIHVPEKPPYPELPKPFVAHTLYAPRLPDNLPSPPDPYSICPPHSRTRHRGDDDDNDDDDRKKILKKFLQRLLLPPRRPSQTSAQPSPRYLKLLRDGAREHDLPADYQAYLSRLEAYTITTASQAVGRLLVAVLAFPVLGLLLLLDRLIVDKDGDVPRWLGMAVTVYVNLLWMGYDSVLRRLCGDGERTIPDEDDDDVDDRDGGDVKRGFGKMNRDGGGDFGDEKNTLLSDW